MQLCTYIYTHTHTYIYINVTISISPWSPHILSFYTCDMPAGFQTVVLLDRKVCLRNVCPKTQGSTSLENHFRFISKSSGRTLHSETHHRHTYQKLRFESRFCFIQSWKPAQHPEGFFTYGYIKVITFKRKGYLFQILILSIQYLSIPQSANGTSKTGETCCK